MTEDPPKNLQRVLGFWSGVAIVIGTIIGTGIFMSPGRVAGHFSSPGFIIILWIIGGLISLVGALTFAELMSIQPRVGGTYALLRTAYGDLLPFVFGWTMLLVISPTALGAFGVTFATFWVELFYPSGTLLKNLPEAGMLCAAPLIVLTILNCCGLKTSTGVMNAVTMLKFLILLFICLVTAAFFGKGSGANLTPLLTLQQVKTESFIAAIALSMNAVLWAYDGWINLAYMSGEVKNPQKNITKILIVGTLAVTGIYIATNLAYYYMLPVSEVAKGGVAGKTMEILLGPGGKVFITAGVLVSTLGVLHGSLYTVIRIFYAMSRDGLTFSFVGRLNRFQAPYVVLLLQGTMASILVFMKPSFEDFIGDFGVASWIFYLMAGTTLFVFRRRFKPEEYPYRAPTLIPVLFFIIGLAFLSFNFYNDITTTDRSQWISLAKYGILLMAVPFYYLWKSTARRYPNG